MMGKKVFSNFKIFFIFLFSIIIEMKSEYESESITHLKSLFPYSLILNNYNILLLTSNQIIFFDSSLNYIKLYNLSANEIIAV